MKYKAIYNPELVLLNRNGDICINSTTGQELRFVHRELIIGDTTTNSAGYIIDATTQTIVPNSLQRLLPVACDGHTVTDDQATNLERAGMTDWTVPVTDPYYYKRLFYEAPTLTGTHAVVDGMTYIVISGTVTQNSVDYTIGETFKAVGTYTSGTGTFELEMSVNKGCCYDRAAEFAKKLLPCTDDAIGYGTDANGFTARNSNNYQDIDFMGYNL